MRAYTLRLFEMSMLEKLATEVTEGIEINSSNPELVIENIEIPVDKETINIFVLLFPKSIIMLVGGPRIGI